MYYAFNSRFDLNLQFLSSSEILTLRKLMEHLNNRFLKYKDNLNEDGITEDTLTDLQHKYRIYGKSNLFNINGKSN